MKFLVLLVPVVFFLSACAAFPRHVGKPVPVDHLAEIERPEIPLVMNNQVQDWLDFFQGNGRERFERYLVRSGRYIPMMKRVLQEHGLPENLVYLALIESGFNPHAYSRARATGAWQFIYRTGIRYGLQVDSWIDERRDPEKSSIAAAKYLRDLYDRFNNWYLAAAGYNAGEGKINRAIRKYATEDFWQLSQGRYLRSETKNYVPKLIAAAMISSYPEKYGFKNVSYEDPISFDEVVLDEPIDLRVAARCSESTYEEIKGLNPELLHWITPPDYKGYRLKLPEGTSEKFEANLALLQPGERLGEETLKVSVRTSLERLALKKMVSVKLLAAANGLRPHDVVGPSQILVLPYPPPEGERFSEKVYERRKGKGGKKRGSKTVASRARQGFIIHTVQTGDTLSEIADRYNVSIQQIRSINKIGRARSLKAGRALKIPVRQTASSI